MDLLLVDAIAKVAASNFLLPPRPRRESRIAATDTAARSRAFGAARPINGSPPFEYGQKVKRRRPIPAATTPVEKEKE